LKRFAYSSMWVLAILVLGGTIVLSVSGVIPSLWEYLVKKQEQNQTSVEVPNLDFYTKNNISEDEYEELLIYIDKKNVGAILETVERAEMFSWSTKTTFMDALMNAELTKNYSAEVSGADFTVSEYRAGALLETITKTGTELVYTSVAGGTPHTMTVPFDEPVERYNAAPLISDFDASAESEAFKVKLTTINLMNEIHDVIYIEFGNEELNIRETYWFSLKYGLILSAQISFSDMETAYYSFETTALS